MKRQKKDQTELQRDEVPFVHFLLYQVFFNFVKLYILLKCQLANADLRRKKKSYWTAQRNAKLFKLFLVNYQFSSFCIFFTLPLKETCSFSYEYGFSDDIYVTGFYFGNLRLKINSFTNIFCAQFNH